MPKYLDEAGVAYLWEKIKNKTNNKITYYSGTKLDWDSDKTLIAEKGTFYIYLDYKKIQKEDGQEVYMPGIKIGDGSSFLIDLPFINDTSDSDIKRFQNLILDHINDKIVHIQPGEREFWNNKLNYSFDDSNDNLILNRL